MFWSRSIFRGRSRRESASIVYDNEQSDLICSPGWRRNLEKHKKNLGEVLEKNEGEWTRKVEISSRKNRLVVGKACKAVFWPTWPDFKGRTFEFGVLGRGDFNFDVCSNPSRRMGQGVGAYSDRLSHVIDNNRCSYKAVLCPSHYQTNAEYRALEYIAICYCHHTLSCH